jgi:hypothetical protein
MGNKEWDNYLKDILGEFKSEGETPRWDDFTRQYTPKGTPETGPDQLADEALKESLTNYSPLAEIKGWDRIEASLDETDKAFDEEVRHKLRHYHAPSDPHSWTLFLKHFSSHKLLRAKLITLKVLESAAVALLLITVLHLGQIGKIPSLNPMAEEVHSSENKSTDLNETPKVISNQDRPEEGSFNEKSIAARNETRTSEPVTTIISREDVTKDIYSRSQFSISSNEKATETFSIGSSNEMHAPLHVASSIAPQIVH